MASAGSLIFELAADVSHLRADMQKANATITDSLDSIAKSTAATALITGAEFAFNFAKGFADTIKQAIDQVDALNDLSQKIGASTEEISALGYAAQLSGSNLEDVTTGMRGLAKALVEAKDPASTAGKALASIGLSAAQLKGQNPAQAFITISQAISGFRDGADKAAVAMALLGKAGTQLIPTMNNGAQGIADLTKEAQDLGVIVDTATAQSMADLNDDIDRMKAAGQGLAITFAREMTDAFKEVIRLMKEAKTAGSGMNDGLMMLATTAKTVIATIIGLGGTVASLAAVATGFAGLAASLTKPGGMNEGLDAMAKGWAKGQNIMFETVNSMDRISHKMTDQEKATAAAAAATKAATAANEDANKKQLNFDPSVKSAKAAKKEIDEYGKMVEDLTKKLVALTTNGNPMAEMLADPKFKKLTMDQQESIKELMNDYLDLKAATDQEKQAQADLDAQYQKGAEAQASYNKTLESTTESQLDAIQPLRVNIREMALYTDALERHIITQQQFDKLSDASRERFRKTYEGITPMTEQTKALTQAIEGFGMKSADAFVEFASGADTLGNSFRKMVADMLKELAKMLVYQYVFKGMFSNVSSTVGGWMNAIPGGGVSTASASSGVPSGLSSSAVLGRSAPGATSSGGGSTGGGGGGWNPGVAVTVHIDRSNRETQETTANDKSAADLGNRIASVVRQVISTEKRTGGLLAG